MYKGLKKIGNYVANTGRAVILGTGLTAAAIFGGCKYSGNAEVTIDRPSAAAAEKKLEGQQSIRDLHIAVAEISGGLDAIVDDYKIHNKSEEKTTVDGKEQVSYLDEFKELGDLMKDAEAVKGLVAQSGNDNLKKLYKDAVERLDDLVYNKIAADVKVRLVFSVQEEKEMHRTYGLRKDDRFDESYMLEGSLKELAEKFGGSTPEQRLNFLGTALRQAPYGRASIKGDPSRSALADVRHTYGVQVTPDQFAKIAEHLAPNGYAQLTAEGKTRKALNKALWKQWTDNKLENFEVRNVSLMPVLMEEFDLEKPAAPAGGAARPAAPAPAAQPAGNAGGRSN